ncbi:hypothetical protein [Methylomagnum sp.]
MLDFKAQKSTTTAYGIDLGTTNSTLCRVDLPAGETTVPEPEAMEIPQPTPGMGQKIGRVAWSSWNIL